MVLNSNLHHSYSATPIQPQIERFEILNNERKVPPDRSSLSEVYIYRNNQNAIALVVIRPNHDDNFLSRE
jgi:hypothetical protein